MRKPISIDLYQLLYNGTSTQRVMQTLSKHPDKEFSLTELAKEAKIAKANIGRILFSLEKSELIRITKLANIWRISANQNNKNFINAKIAQNISFIYLSGIIPILEEKYQHPRAIILFGSYRKGDDTTGSDIDIAIECETKDHEILRLKELEQIEKKAEREIQIHLFNRKDIDINVFNNIANGIVLSGFLEVKK